ncbi:MAG: DUF1611 domain-containing protein [Pseudomonadota bacterium]
MPAHALPAPFLLFLGDAERLSDIKTAAGVLQWRTADCVGEWRLNAQATSLGLAQLQPAAAHAAGARALLIGVAPLGGRLPSSWLEPLASAARAGLHLVNGLHDRLSDYPELVGAARDGAVTLIDLRVPPQALPIGTGTPRSGNRVLTVGTDCAVGKKYTALALTQALRDRGVDTDFCATGQTGIMIAERGIPLDAVPADFLSGAIEALSPAADPLHWDVIEGQGSLFHPSYAGVSLGLLHGAQPDALVLCHAAGRRELDDLPGFPIPPLADCAALILAHARLTNPQAQLAAVSLNTSDLDPEAAERELERAAQALGVPAFDPLKSDLTPVIDVLLEH